MSWDNILYYPSINLPQTPWVTQSILYWDQVSTIVPYEYFEKPELLEKEMHELVIAGAVIQEPTINYGPQEYEASRGIFKTLLQNQYNFHELRRSFQAGNRWKIHKEKFSDELFDHLVAWGLAIRQNNEYWYWVEESVAASMMTVLATLIGEQTKAIPSTDDMKFLPEGGLYMPVQSEKEYFRSRILDEVLPYPENFTVSDLVNFKEKYFSELKDFRRLIERRVLLIQSLGKKEIQEEALQLDIDEIMDRREELEERLKENKFSKIGMSTIKTAVVETAISLIAGDIVTPTATILNGINETRKQYMENPIRDEDLAYIALLNHKAR
jgi:hypothetical protein